MKHLLLIGTGWDQLLGEVNHSQFYQGYDASTQTRVIVRLIDLDQENRKFRHKLEGFVQNEFRVVADLAHPNVLRILDFGLDKNLYYQINEYITFTTLHQYLLEHHPLELEAVLRFALEIADTTAYFHHINIIHCDLKPENILVNRGHLKLMEFSIANHVLEHGIVTGTPPYMSPEAASGAPPEPSRDIWALGIILFEMLSGRLPFQVEGRMQDPSAMPELLHKIVRDPVPSIENFVPNLPSRLLALLNWMLEKDVTQRISSMRQVAVEIETILTSLQKSGKRLQVGEVIAEQYRLQSIIAEGGFGQVFAGADLHTGRKIAVKKLKPDLAQQAQYLSRFKREAEILSRLDHPRIVKVLDTLENDSDHYIVMEYVEGGDLRSLLKEGAIPFKKAVKLGAEIADALARVHQVDIIHRDIKPENVLLTADGAQQLTDFGVSYVAGATRLTETHGLIGTFQYMAPEVLQGSSPSKQSDIWSFGLLLYEMLTGIQPFLRTTVSQIIVAILNEPIPDIRIRCNECTEAIANLMTNMLEWDIAKRISSMDEIVSVEVTP